MTRLEKLRYIRSRITEEDILCTVAEEASELAKAALKLRRAITETNPTPVGFEVARSMVLEEIADVQVAFDVFIQSVNDMETIEHTYEYKFERWVKRLEERKSGNETNF